MLIPFQWGRLNTKSLTSYIVHHIAVLLVYHVLAYGHLYKCTVQFVHIGFSLTCIRNMRSVSYVFTRLMLKLVWRVKSNSLQCSWCKRNSKDLNQKYHTHALSFIYLSKLTGATVVHIKKGYFTARYLCMVWHDEFNCMQFPYSMCISRVHSIKNANVDVTKFHRHAKTAGSSRQFG